VEAAMFKRIDHVEIIPKNIDESIEFYTNVLGFKVKERNRMSMPGLTEISYLTLGDTMIEMLAFKEPVTVPEAPQVGYRMMALEVDDMDKTVE
jgi:glyoxylase I family protein